MSRTEKLLKALLEDGSVGFEPQSRIGMALENTKILFKEMIIWE